MGNEAEIKFFTHRFSPFTQRVAVALKEKNIPFEKIEVDFTNKPKELLEANPIYGKVPTIIHNGKPVAESLVILEYLEDAFPEQVPLMPKDAYERSKVRFWIDYICKVYSALYDVYRSKPGSPERQAACEESMNALRTLNAGMTSLSAGPFFAGDKFGILDAALVPFCILLPLQEKMGTGVVFSPDETPRLHKWIETVSVYPSVSSVLPTLDETQAFLSSRMEKAAEAAAAAK